MRATWISSLLLGCWLYAAPVHARMLVEARILDSEEGFLQLVGNLVHGDRVAPGLPELRNQPPFAGIDVHRHLQFDMPEAIDVG